FLRLLPSYTSDYRRDHPHLHPFPTRRSSDLGEGRRIVQRLGPPDRDAPLGRIVAELDVDVVQDLDMVANETDRIDRDFADALGRSEEHTSELQSHLNLVCRLMLEKKKPYCIQ